MRLHGAGICASLVQTHGIIRRIERAGWLDNEGGKQEESGVSADFFTEVSGPIPFGGLDSTDPLAFKVYQPDRLVLGKRMEDHLRIAVCLWHSFNWPGSDVFGLGTFDRPWLDPRLDPMIAARAKLDAAFEFLTKLGVPFFCFHDRDIAPEGRTFAESRANLDAMIEQAQAQMSRTGRRLLWGTANLFSHPRYAAGAATNPDPEVFAYAAAQVKVMLEATHRLDGDNYVLWGGREGYETLLNTDLAREEAQLARFLAMVAEHKHRIGFKGTLLIEPKPQEPTKHQYDYDAATVHGFLVRHGLDDEYRVNLEVNHATLAGHSFHHEVAYAITHGIFGSVDANRGDYQNGWDTDQFPNSVDELSLAVYEILRGGGFTTGGFNFDTKLRRQSLDRTDLFHAHVGGIDTLARALLVAAELIESQALEQARDARYAGWTQALGRSILSGEALFEMLAGRVETGEIDPQPVSGRQESLENRVNQAIWSADRSWIEEAAGR
jgi:xylose isomerase